MHLNSSFQIIMKFVIYLYSLLFENVNSDSWKFLLKKYIGVVFSFWDLLLLNILDSKLDFNIHVDNKIEKCYKIIVIIKRLSVSAPRKL